MRQANTTLVEANDKLRTEAAERERIEAALRPSHKMEAVGELTGELAHHFNNLLAGIFGSLELIHTRIAQGARQRPAAMSRRRCRLSAVQPRSRTGCSPSRVARHSIRNRLGLTGLSGSMADIFRRTVGPSIRIETKLAGGLWPALCDPNQLENALLNLIINARDAMPDGGHLLIEAANLGQR